MILASADLAAATLTEVYVVAPDKRAIITLNLCNRGAALARVSVAIVATPEAAPGPADWIEFETPLPPAGSDGGSTQQVTGIALSEGQAVYVRSDQAEVSAVVHGVVEAI